METQKNDVAVEAVAPMQRRSLDELLSLMRATDDDVLDYDVDLEELGVDLRSKVDNIVSFLDYCEARALALGKRAAELSAKSAAFKNKGARLEARVGDVMDFDRKARIAKGEPAEGPYRLPGVSFEFVLKYSERVKEKRAADPAMYLKLKGFVRRTYEWDKTALKKALKANNAAAIEVAEITRHANVEIKPKA